MYRLKLFICIVVLAISLKSSAKTLMDSFLFSTVYIKNLSSEKAGTGFIVSRKISEERIVVFLVSNKHVLSPKAIDPNQTNHLAQAEISINTAEGNDIKRENMKVTLRDASGTVCYKVHPDPSVDIAALIITQDLNEIITRGSKLHGIPESRFATREFIKKNFISIGDEAILIGYPLNLVEEGHVIPVARSAIIATKPDYDFRNQPIFLIDATVLRGSSGSPVILPIKPYKWNKENSVVNTIQQNHLLGIISGSVKDWEMVIRKVVTPEIQQEFTVTDTANLGIVFRAETISRVLDLFGYKCWKDTKDEKGSIQQPDSSQR